MGVRIVANPAWAGGHWCYSAIGTVIPAQAGIQSPCFESQAGGRSIPTVFAPCSSSLRLCELFECSLDSRLRGNDGEGGRSWLPFELVSMEAALLHYTNCTKRRSPPSATEASSAGASDI